MTGRVVYRRSTEEKSHPDLYPAMFQLPIVKALLLLREVEVRRGNYCGRKDDRERYNCTRTQGHLPPHISAERDYVLVIWFDQ